MSDDEVDFKAAVLAADRGCICDSPESPCDGDLFAHHVITQQQLRKHGLADYLGDPNVGAAACYRHHRRHHNRVEPMKREALPARCVEFAERHELGWIIDRYYV